MQSLTLPIALSASGLALLLPPVYALITYVGALVLCPYYLTTELGTLNFSVARIVILALYGNILLRGNLPNRFKFMWPDKLMIIFFVCQLMAGSTSNPNILQLLENRAGRFFDMALPYFAARLIIRNRQQYILFLKGVLCIAAILAIPASYESVTGRSPFDFGTGLLSGPRTYRLGLARAAGPFGNAIQFGIFFAMAGGVCAGLLKTGRKHIWLYGTGMVLTLLGVFFSMSTGSWLVAIATTFFIVFYGLRRYWKQAALMIVIMCAAVEIVSNRHFYNVADRLALNARTAWYRSRLIEVALFEGGMSGHWMTGYGLADPGWGPRLDGRSHTDMVNHYLLILSRFGILGFIPFCGLIISALGKLFEKFWSLNHDRDTWLIWCLAGVLFGVLLTFNSVSIFPPCRNFFYIVLALCPALSDIVSARTVPTTHLYTKRSADLCASNDRHSRGTSAGKKGWVQKQPATLNYVPEVE